VNHETRAADGGLLRNNRDYLLWWCGNLASSTGNQFALVAMPLMVLLITGSPFQAGLVASMEALPYIILSLPVGAIVDRLPRRRLLVVTSIVSLVAFASIPIAYGAGHFTSAQLYVVAFVNGCATVVFSVAQQAALPMLIAKKHIGQAAGQAETVERLAAILGPPASAFMFDQWWPAAPFAVDALSFGVIVIALWRIRADMGPASSRGPARRNEPLTESVRRTELLSGARSLFSVPLLRDLTLLNSAGDMLFAGIALLMVVLVTNIGASGAFVGLVFSLAAVGGLLGSVVANRLVERIGLPTAVIGKHILTAALFPLFLFHLPAVGIGLIWGVISFQISIVGVIQRKYVLLETPDELLGRVQSITTFLSFGALPIGTAATGFLLQTLDADGTVTAYTVGLAALAVWSFSSKAIRTGGRATG
jgi:predicted MFS family arabinose efflux permease